MLQIINNIIRKINFYPKLLKSKKCKIALHLVKLSYIFLGLNRDNSYLII